MKIFKGVSEVIENITVEPAVFLYYLANDLIDAIGTNLYLQKSCRFNVSSEPNLDTPCDDEKQGVLFVSSFNGNYRLCGLIVMVTMVILLMSWSDKAGKQRKTIIFLPIIGMIIQSLNGCVQSYFWTWPPLLGAIVDFTSHALSGGFLLMFFSAQLYVCDITNSADRTMRIGILLSVTNISHPLGTAVAGFLIKGIGFFNSCSLCLLLSIASLVSAMILVKDISIPVPGKVSILSLFKFTQIVDSYKVTFKKSLGKKRIVVLLLLMVHLVVLISNEGRST